ncbi:glycoside hydrolase family 2 protein [Mucilaginibacter terrae]|uniref:glycoside hydrolase family 2 protein n=1 Tax=Mucilaginibacter terrae TaxID=1955052 RepID=UPI0036344FAC
MVKYLSGIDKDHTQLWDFYCTKGSHSGQWSKIAVPSNWQLQGFGSYYYGRDAQPELGESGLYKTTFTVPTTYANKRIFIVFEGAMTDTEVKINGNSAGEIHQGGYYRFKYDITNLVKLKGDNLLEVKVDGQSANASVNLAERKADFWTFSGIFRPVYLEAVPDSYMDRWAVNAKANGNLSLDVYGVNLKEGSIVSGQLEDLKGNKIGASFVAKSKKGEQTISLNHHFDHIKTWNPEFPNLYNLSISLTDSRGIVHTGKQRFGFRTVELRKHDGIYVNDKRVVFKGVCRHSEWPESGRTMSKDLSILDVKLMKEMNMNAVRMSHYPPDQHFLDVCDSLGLFVLDELTGWSRSLDTIVGRKLVKEMVVRDVNHPSIVFWDNGNEGGWNTNLDSDFSLYDPQKRLVLHPWDRFNGIDTRHYPEYNYLVNNLLYGNDVYLPTEFVHGNYDGGAGATLDDYWNIMMQYPYFAGGFVWAFADEGVIRKDRNNEMDTSNERAPDGIVGPHREKEGSFFTIKEIWSPVYINMRVISPSFAGTVPMENRYIYTNLKQCHFSYELVTFPLSTDKITKPKVNYTRQVPAFNLEPGAKGFLNLNLPAQWRQNDALYLTATDPYGKKIFKWTWSIKSAAQIALKNIGSKSESKNDVTFKNIDESLIINAGNMVYTFDKKNGLLKSVNKNGTLISLKNGPVLAGVKLELESFKTNQQDGSLILQANFNGDKNFLKTKWTFKTGLPAKLEYSYLQRGDADFRGITFDYPEDKVTGMKWLGRGPYRVWKNRLKGQEFGLWHKAYNNTITGETYKYPEFKGYHAQLYWTVIENKESQFTVFTEDTNLFLEMMKPDNSVHAPKALQPAFPEGNLGFLNAISPIGAKFHSATGLGPQGEKNVMPNSTPVSGTLWFDFR